jgi:hypothetical protein
MAGSQSRRDSVLRHGKPPLMMNKPRLAAGRWLIYVHHSQRVRETFGL